MTKAATTAGAEAQHPFGELLSQYRQRKAGLSQRRLAELAGYDQAILVRMAQGKKDLTGPSGRERIMRLIETLIDQNAIHSLEEANALLLAANLPPLFERQPAEAKLIARFEKMPAGHRVRRTNLPAPLAGFIGRAQEIADVKRLLKSTRLLTLTGSGGAGKTRLAQQVAADVLITYADGVWYAELAALQDGGLIADALVRALGLAIIDKPALEHVCDFLRERHVLLVLDNCEHLIDDVAAFVIAVLQACPRVTILTTSREALNVEGEATWRVPPMQPDEAAQLFVARAQAARGSILNEQDATVMQICRRLDGMPLAIELAASRLQVMSLSDIAAGLDDRFTLLAHGRRGALPRHQTLRAMIDWSHELLTEKEKVVFRQLGVFVGGWTLEDAAQVVDVDGFPVLHEQMIGKSLVTVDDDGDMVRYHFLETIREYALEKLNEAGEQDSTRRRHAEAFKQIAEASAEPLHGPHQREWLARLRLDYPNLQAAMTWCLQPGGDALTGCRLVGALFHFWYVASEYRSDTQDWIRAAIRVLTDDMPPAVRGWIFLDEEYFIGGVDTAEARCQRIHELFVQAGDLIHAAMVKTIIGRAFFYGKLDYPLALRWSEDGVAEARALGAGWELRFNLEMLGECLRFAQHDPVRAEASYREAMLLSKAAGDMATYARTLGYYIGGFAMERLQFEESLRCNQEAIAIAETFGDVQTVMRDSCSVAENLVYLNRHAEALEWLEASTRLAAEHRNFFIIISAKVVQARMAIADGDFVQASMLLKESLNMRRERLRSGEFLWGAHTTLDAMSSLAGAQGQAHRAALPTACLRAITITDAQTSFGNMRPTWRRRTRRWAMQPDAAHAEGRNMPLDQAVAYALGED